MSSELQAMPLVLNQEVQDPQIRIHRHQVPCWIKGLYVYLYISLYMYVFMKCRRAECHCRVPGRIKGEHSHIPNRQHESVASHLQNKTTETSLDRRNHGAAHSPPVQALLVSGRGGKTHMPDAKG